MKAEEHRERKEQIGRWPINVVSYRIGTEWICTVDNVSPGANIARATGTSRDEAERQAIEKAKERVAQTRTHQV